MRNRFLPILLLMISPLAGCKPAPQSIHDAGRISIPGSVAAPGNTPTLSPVPTFTASATPTESPLPVGENLVYISEETGQGQIFTVDIEHGTKKQLTFGTYEVEFLNCAPDGSAIAYQLNRAGNREIWRMDWDGGNNVRLVSDDGHYPVWSPDSKRIAYFSRIPGSWSLYTMDPDGALKVMVKDDNVFESIVSWSPDSRRIAFNPWHNTISPPFIAVIGPARSGYVELTDGKHSDLDPEWSPRDDLIVFSSWRTGRSQVFLMRADGSGQQALTDSAGGNSNPKWSPDGNRIVFVSWRDSADPDHCRDGDCNFEIYIMDKDGNGETRLTDDPGEDWGGVLSPDGKRIAFLSLRDEPRHPEECDETCNSEIFVMDDAGENIVRVTDNTFPDYRPAWRPNPSGVSG
jgi:Tol biopolymer transport system component